ncbi:MAG: PAS domain-containing hybrid sensor histidine kinase/response regulator, partial [Desulfomonilaceae bacterium]
QVWYLTDPKTYGLVNQSRADFLGKHREEIEGKQLDDFYSHDVAAVCEVGNAEVFQSGRTIQTEELIPDGAGEPRLLSITKTPKLDEHGKVEYVVCSGTDITERKRLEESLRESKQTLNRILEASPVGIAFTGSDRYLRWVNNSWLQLFGYESVEEIKGLPVNLFYVSEEEFNRITNLMSSFCSKGEPAVTDTIFKRKNGEIFDVHLRVNPFDPTDMSKGFVSTVQDISDMKKAQRELQASNDQFEAFMENSPLMAFIKDERGRYVYANTMWQSQMGQESGDWKGKTSDQVLPPDVCLRCLETDNNVLYDNMASEYIEQFVDHTGEKHSWLMYKFPIKGSNGNKLIGGVAIDISERLRAEESLRQSERRFRELTELLPIGVFESDVTGKFLFVNPAALEISGHTLDEMLTQVRIFDLVIPEERDKLSENIQKKIRGQTIQMVEYTVLTKDGKAVPVLVSSSPIYENDKIVGIRGVVSDISALKRAEQEKIALQSQLFQSQKLESLGTLVGGIAHDFNNMLQIIIGYSQFLMDYHKKGDPGHGDLQTIIETSKEAADLVTKLLAFGQQAQTIPTEINLNDRIRELSTVISRTLPHIIRLDLDLTDRPTTILADKGEIDQLFMNLAINASEAMPDGGGLKVTTSIVSLDEDYCKEHLEAKPGDYVMLSVRDTGRGMDTETKSRIFDPFFSTKQRGPTRGTGLGLSVARGIVQQRGGHITCESEPGEGTEFKVYFPIIDSKDQPMGPKKILIVEDNDKVAQFEKKVLESSGYKVIIAFNGKEAIEKFRAKRDEISLVILDMILPEKSGRDCLMEMLAIDPSVKVLVASGYSMEGALKEEITPLVKGFVHKPFVIADLISAVHGALENVACFQSSNKGPWMAK